MQNWNHISDHVQNKLKDTVSKLCLEDDVMIGDSIFQKDQYNRNTKQYDVSPLIAKMRWQKRKKRIFRYSVVAAMLAVTLGVAVLMLQKTDSVVSQELHIAQSIQPGTTRAILTKCDGSVEQLIDPSYEVAKHMQAPIVNEEKIMAESQQPKYNVLTITRGAEYAVTLADGTKVWLNADSELKFPDNFTDGERKVMLKGEAYFDVEKGNTPFIVELANGTVKVYGTEFNVNDYNDDEIDIVLVKGLVGFKTPSNRETRMLPSQHLKYTLCDDKVELKTVDPVTFISWKDNYLNFEDESLENIIKKLERWYDFETIFQTDDLKHIRLTGAIDKYEDIERFFTLFENTMNIEFIVNGKQVIVRRK
ncbi:MAG: FecR family protein [Marinifilaceae bacterium]